MSAVAPHAASQAARLAVDIGGTFTDVVLETEKGAQITTKLLTTHEHPGIAVLEGINTVMQQADSKPQDIGLIIHGTTLATNALIERRGAKTALLTTEGHRDALEMAHEDRFEQYDINIDRPVPLVPRYLRLPIVERMDKDGKILIPFEPESVMRALPILDQYAVESVAIGYLHGFVNPLHEQQTAETLLKARPALSISLASEVAPEIREFERLSTACANAYVRPMMARYLNRLAGEFVELGFHCPFFLMTSGGGITTLETATKFPIRLVESGPAGGAILAQRLARELGINRMLSFDMGGTTAKLCLIDDGQPLMSRSFEVDRVYRFKKGSGLPVRIPVIEMVEIGAGGGSIARIDKLQRLQIGPESAGSEPGPAVYGRGGDQPTVTDADFHLGKIYVEKFAGGSLNLDLSAPEKVISEKIGKHQKLDCDLAAFGISEVVNENMAAAARAHAAEFGMDLGERDIVAFGGAAPLHAARLAQKLGANRIVIPTHAGVGSAIGFLLAPISFEVVRSRQQKLSQLNVALINQLFADMHKESLAVVRQGSLNEALIESRQAFMRYVGQGHEIAINLPVETYLPAHDDIFRKAFEDAYGKLYGHIIEGIDIEVLSWTLTIADPSTSDLERTNHNECPVEPQPVGQQMVFDPILLTRTSTPVYLRSDLPTGTVIPGPALITEDQTTTVVTSCFEASIDSRGYIILTRAEHDPIT